ncbi:unnamed protein product [Prorocentrum cordatum]|uniref:Uncharacterized protein n=1 Tax=Prorocentrum cordatum TaxID=2364126 RepID=A0ABN9UEZ5_9DINO|nr:unnamed protein product [Polarella glacialis]
MTAVGIERALTTLRQKFRRVFFTPGDHDLQIHQTEHARYPDSMAKFIAIISLCDDLGVDICPAPIWDGLLVVPILSWYDVEYDVNDPFPDPNVQTDAECKWPMDADTQAGLGEGGAG